MLGEENIFRIPDGFEEEIDPHKVANYPSPEELKYKFIVKCKAPKRIPIALTKEGEYFLRRMEEKLKAVS